MEPGEEEEAIFDIDQLLRDERFDELARLGAIPAYRRAAASGTTIRTPIGRTLRSRGAGSRPAEAGTPTIRQAVIDDKHKIAQLADMDELPTPEGRILIAEVESEILAAPPLDGGPAIAYRYARQAASSTYSRCGRDNLTAQVLGPQTAKEPVQLFVDGKGIEILQDREHLLRPDA